MKIAACLIAFLAFAGPACAQQQAYCPYGQTCQNSTPVPFPVINPVAGLNVLNPGKLLPQQQPPAPTYRPTTPTPPPVMPPAR